MTNCWKFGTWDRRTSTRPWIEAMREEVYAALERYYAMVGQLQGIPEDVERQAVRDRERFGETYLSRGKDGRHAWHPLPMIRFLTEACGIPLRESREAVIEDARSTGVRMDDRDWTPPEEQARKLLATFGNILEARAYAAFLVEMLGGDERAASYWRDVVHAIDTVRFVPEDTEAEWR